jgi:predicted component of type VI protein secretion system
MKAELVPENGDAPIPIVKDLTLVGRHADCDVVIDNAGLSKRHCVLVKTDGLLVIRDLATTNGTKVKGQRIRWAALLPDDRVTLGGYKIRIYLGSDEIPSPSEQRQAGRAGTVRSGAGYSRGVGSARQDAANTPKAGASATQAPERPSGSFAEPSPIDLPAAAIPNGQGQGGHAPAQGQVEEFLFALDDDDDEIIDLE